jgi:ABC-2 type transport system permease protein
MKSIGANNKSLKTMRYLIDHIKQTVHYFKSEIWTILHDPGALLIFAIAMVIYPVLYSLGYSKETIREIPVAIVDLDHSQISRQYGRMADATEQLKVTCKPGSLVEAEQLFFAGKVYGVILIPDNFERSVLRNEQTTVTVYCDASYFLLYKQVYAGISYSCGTLSGGIEVKKMLAEGKTLQQAKELQDPLKTELFNLYNPSGGYGTFVVPGIMLVIMQQTLLIGIALLAGTIRKKDKYRHLSNQVSKKWGVFSIIIGKSSAYVLIYIINSVFAAFLLHRMMSFPDKSGFLMTLVILIPYFYAISFLGLSISVFFRDRAHSLMFLVFLSPIVMFLSGISWPTSALPKLLYSLAHIFPSTNAVPAYLRMRTMGASIISVRPELVILLIQMVIYFAIACIAYKIMIKRIGRSRAIVEKL